VRAELPAPHDFTTAVETVARGLLAVGRLSACVAIGEAEAANKLRCSEEASAYIEATDALLRTLNDYADTRDGFSVAWPTRISSSDSDTRELTSAEADALRNQLYDSTRAIGVSLLQQLHDTPLLAYTSRELERAVALLPDDYPTGSTPLLAFSRPERDTGSQDCPIRRLYGPRDSPLSLLVERRDSLVDCPAPIYSERLEEVVPFLWVLSTREGMASDLCSLSIVEYDRLPLRFYRDFAKQAVDEASHSSFFMAAALDLMDECVQSLPSEHPVRTTIEGYRRGALQLPVPREGNLYEAIWAADLTERLVIMHHDTEGPAVKHIAARLEDEFCRSHPAIRRGFEIDRYDEISHAAIGARWLRHLYPDRSERRQAIKRAREMRGILLLAAIARHGDKPLIELVTHYSRPSTDVGADRAVTPTD
jgi:hypothetical protein